MTRFACETPATGPAAQLAHTLRAVIPTLSTARLTLRPTELTDFPCFADIVCSARGQYIGGPMTREDAWFDFISLSAGWVLHGHGGWTIADKTTGVPLGFVILGFEPGDLEPELGFLLSEDAERRGIAYEAAGAAKSFARDNLHLPSLVSYIHRDNARSAKLAKRLGASNTGPVPGADDIHAHRHWGPAPCQ